MLLVIAASVQDQVEKYGAYVGIAAFFGLAALTLLYFSQARELKRLRDWAGRAPERSAELEAKVVAQADERRVRTPVPKPATAVAANQAAKAAVAGGAATAAAVQAATALANRPAAEQATDGDAPPPQAVPGAETPNAATAGTAEATPGGAAPEETAPAATAATATTDGPAPAPGSADGVTPGVGTPGGATPAGTVPNAATAGTDRPTPPSGIGQETQESAVLDEDTGEEDAIAGNGSSSGAPVIPRATPAPQRAAALRTSSPHASPRRPVPPPRRPAAAPPRRQESRSARNSVLAILGVIVVVGLGALAATQIFGGDDGTTDPNTSPNVAQTPQAGDGSTANTDEGGTQTLSRAETQVSVFNGTTISGLAATTADKLRTAGFPAPLTGNNPDQQRAATLVLYASRAARRSAQEVGRLLKVSEPEAMDERTRAQAGPEADVVVIVGSDQTQ